MGEVKVVATVKKRYFEATSSQFKVPKLLANRTGVNGRKTSVKVPIHNCQKFVYHLSHLLSVHHGVTARSFNRTLCVQCTHTTVSGPIGTIQCLKVALDQYI